MLPVATPPNAIAFGTGRLLTTDTVSLHPIVINHCFWSYDMNQFLILILACRRICSKTDWYHHCQHFHCSLWTNSIQYWRISMLCTGIFSNPALSKFKIISVCILLCECCQSSAKLSPWCEHLCCILLIFAKLSVFMFAKWLCITHCPSLSDNLLKRMILRITEIGYFFCSAFNTLKLPSWFQTL